MELEIKNVSHTYKMEKKHYQKFPQVLPLVCMVS